MTSAEDQSKRSDRLPYCLYGAIALIALGLVSFHYHFAAAEYVRMVSEDQWAEYGTSVCFLVATAAAVHVAWSSRSARRRVVFALIALAAFFIAGEEISWGQRMFGLEVPEPILRHNQQSELTIHNLEQVRALEPQYVLAWALGIWCIVSIAASRSPGLARALGRFALPTFPGPVIPLFMLYPLVYAVHQLPGWTEIFRKDEIAEWFLGIAVFVWAFDLIAVRERHAPLRGAPFVAALLCVSAAVLALSVALPRWFPTDDFKYQLQRAASKAYPSRGLFAQSEQAYAFIYAHPEMITSSTRLHHGQVLLQDGRRVEAMRVLANALEELQDDPDPRVATLRRRGTIHLLMGESDRAMIEFDRAIEQDRESLRSAESDPARSEILISIAQTLEASGDVSGAIEAAREAEALAPSALLRVKIDRGHGF
jgi:hypothetical protein